MIEDVEVVFVAEPTLEHGVTLVGGDRRLRRLVEHSFGWVVQNPVSSAAVVSWSGSGTISMGMRSSRL
jgi:hypothetical protein